ncbi:MAG: competence type IV pilus major pilin ComGC [Filifactoraceae bacterium]
MKKKKGFTLVELVVVIMAIGILMLIGMARFSSISMTAAERTFEANHRLVVSAISMYMADHDGKTPASTEKFEKYIADPSGGATNGIAALQGKPEGKANATYTWDGTKLESTFTASGTGATAKTLTFAP